MWGCPKQKSIASTDISMQRAKLSRNSNHHRRIESLIGIDLKHSKPINSNPISFTSSCQTWGDDDCLVFMISLFYPAVKKILNKFSLHYKITLLKNTEIRRQCPKHWAAVGVYSNTTCSPILSVTAEKAAVSVLVKQAVSICRSFYVKITLLYHREGKMWGLIF